MRVLQAGLPKTGNYLVYRIIGELLREGGIPPRRFITGHPIYEEARHWPLSYPEQAAVDVLDVEPEGCFCSISFRFRERIQDLDAYLARTNHVWTHSPWCAPSHAVFGRFDRIVYVVRDPRDTALSHAEFLFTPYHRAMSPTAHASPETFIEADLELELVHWIEHVSGYLAQRHALPMLVVFYEDLVRDRPAEVRRLARFLGLALDDAAMARVVAATEFQTMREGAPGHVNRGEVGRWMRAFSPELRERATATLGTLPALLGYPEEPVDGPVRPALPADLDAGRWRRACPALTRHLMTRLQREQTLRREIATVDAAHARDRAFIAALAEVVRGHTWLAQMVRAGAGADLFADPAGFGAEWRAEHLRIVEQGGDGACRVAEDVAPAVHRLQRVIDIDGAATWTFQVMAKPAGRSVLALWLLDTSAQHGLEALFDLAGGRVAEKNTYGFGGRVAAAIEPAEDGWFRCTLTGRPHREAITVRASVVLRAAPQGTSVYEGDGASGLWLARPSLRPAAGMPPRP